MGKKYQFTEETLEVDGRILHRIIALKDFYSAKKGDLGGFVEKEDNLSQEGNCWIYDEAVVYNNAIIYDDAIVGECADISGRAMVFENARVCGHARICDNVRVYSNARIYDNAKIYNYAEVGGNASVCGNARIFGTAAILGYAVVHDCAKVSNEVIIYGNTEIKGNAVIKSKSDYIVFKNWWSSGRYFTWTRSNDMWSVGSFYGTGEELIKKAYNDSEESGHNYERIVKYVESIKQELK